MASSGCLSAVIGLAALAVTGCNSDAPSQSPPAGASDAHGQPQRAGVWVLGDGGSRNTAARKLARMIRRARPDLFIYLGDVYPSGRAVDFRQAYAPLYGRLKRRTLATPGNHDWPNARRGYLPYWHHALGRPLPSYYATRAGGWRILSLNSELLGRAMRRQVRWLRRQVAAPGSCRLAFWHRPRFSAGLHGDARDLDPLWRAAEGRVALVLSGHDHDMQQFKPQGGTTQLVSGAGGDSRYRLHRDPRLVFGNSSREGALRLSLQPGRASFAFVASGRVLHRGRVSCRPAS
jgi:predicted phosphodiesterase